MKYYIKLKIEGGKYMSGKRSSNNDDGMGCLLAMFELLGLLLMCLFSSENPVVRNIGWGIVIAIALFCTLVNGGMSGTIAMIIILVLAILVIATAMAYASNKGSGKSENDKTVNHTGTSNNQSAATQKTVETAVTVEKAENVSSVVVEQKVAVQKPKDIYYHSVSEALKQYTVPEDYQKIMIECIQNTDVKECPGLIWKDGTMLYVLPLLKGSKIYNWSLSSVSIILYEKRVDPDTDKEFMEVLQSEIATEFEEVFPEYYFDEANTYTGKFVLPVGLEVTNKSGKILLDMIPAEFHVTGDSSQPDGYVKEYEKLF